MRKFQWAVVWGLILVLLLGCSAVLAENGGSERKPTVSGPWGDAETYDIDVFGWDEIYINVEGATAAKIYGNVVSPYSTGEGERLYWPSGSSIVTNEVYYEIPGEYWLYATACYDPDPNAPDAVWVESNRIKVRCVTQGETPVPAIDTAKSTLTVKQGELAVLAGITPADPVDEQGYWAWEARAYRDQNEEAEMGQPIEYYDYYGKGTLKIPTWSMNPGTYWVELSCCRVGYARNSKKIQLTITEPESPIPTTGAQWKFDKETLSYTTQETIHFFVYTPEGTLDRVRAKINGQTRMVYINYYAEGQTAEISWECDTAGEVTLEAITTGPNGKRILSGIRTVTITDAGNLPAPVVSYAPSVTVGEPFTFSFTIPTENMPNLPEGAEVMYTAELNTMGTGSDWYYDHFSYWSDEVAPGKQITIPGQEGTDSLEYQTTCYLRVEASLEGYSSGITEIALPVLLNDGSAGEHTVTLQAGETGTAYHTNEAIPYMIEAEGANYLWLFDGEHWNGLRTNGGSFASILHVGSGNKSLFARADFPDGSHVYSDPVQLTVLEGNVMPDGGLAITGGSETTPTAIPLEGTVTVTLTGSEHATDYRIRLRDDVDDIRQEWHVAEYVEGNRSFAIPAKLLGIGSWQAIVTMTGPGYEEKTIRVPFTVTGSADSAYMAAESSTGATTRTIHGKAFAPGATQIWIYEKTGETGSNDPVIGRYNGEETNWYYGTEKTGIVELYALAWYEGENPENTEGTLIGSVKLTISADVPMEEPTLVLDRKVIREGETADLVIHTEPVENAERINIQV